MEIFQNFLIATAVIFLGLIYMPGIPPHHDYEAPEPVKKGVLKGPLAQNSLLENAEILDNTLEDPGVFGKGEGFESFAVKGDYIYSGIVTGDIVRWNLKTMKGPWQLVHRWDPKCKTDFDKKRCGRPLGLRFHSSGKLLVADAFKGLYFLDTETRKTVMIVDSDTVIDGRKNLLTNSAALSKNGLIYYTVSSTKYDLMNMVLDGLECNKPTGRVMQYNPKTKEHKVLLDGIAFTNGIALSKKEDFLLVAETFRHKLWKIPLKGGKKEGFNMPGYIDNIKEIEGKDTYLIGICIPNLEGTGDFISETILRRPWLSRLIARILYNAEQAFHFLDQHVYECKLFKLLEFFSNGSVMLLWKTKPYGMILEVDENGNILKSWQDPSGKVAFLSEAVKYKDHLFLGSPFSEFVAKVEY